MRLGPSKYERLRKSILDLEPWCRGCKRKGRNTLAVEVDHILPKHLGGWDVRENLQPLCHDCHRIKTGQEQRKREIKKGSRAIKVRGKICPHGVPLYRVKCTKCTGGPPAPGGAIYGGTNA